MDRVCKEVKFSKDGYHFILNSTVRNKVYTGFVYVIFSIIGLSFADVEPLAAFISLVVLGIGLGLGFFLGRKGVSYMVFIENGVLNIKTEGFMVNASVSVKLEELETFEIAEVSKLMMSRYFSIVSKTKSGNVTVIDSHLLVNRVEVEEIRDKLVELIKIQ